MHLDLQAFLIVRLSGESVMLSWRLAATHRKNHVGLVLHPTCILFLCLKDSLWGLMVLPGDKLTDQVGQCSEVAENHLLHLLHNERQSCTSKRCLRTCSEISKNLARLEILPGVMGRKQQSEGAVWAANRDTLGPLLAHAPHRKRLAYMLQVQVLLWHVLN